MALSAAVHAFYAGRSAPLAGDGRPSAIVKSTLAGPVTIGPLGLLGDEQADRIRHGGPDQALQLYPRGHYSRLAGCFPGAAAVLVPGRLGENLSADLEEDGVCIGDVFALGTARLQVSRPRKPCWKIDVRCGAEGVAARIAESGWTGWYFRVLAPGTAIAGDALRLLERPSDPLSLADLHATLAAHRPAATALRRIVGQPALAAGYREQVAQRLEWLERNP
ncbi:MAG: MOSC domain-containing protein [Rhodocyclaceae bacterium]|nr:MOSC domain-containing protein [Rhodocyclaceae bacterium]